MSSSEVADFVLTFFLFPQKLREMEEERKEMEGSGHKSVTDDIESGISYKIIIKMAVFVDEDTLPKASLNSKQSRTIKVSKI